MDSEFLFTYGTLMQGFANAFADRLRSSSTFLGTGSFPGLLFNITWYPGAVYGTDFDSKVVGEIYRLSDPDKTLSALDEYEDVFEDEAASLYVRKIIPITRPDQTVVHCWAYLYNQPIEGLTRIESGDFRKK